MAPFLAGTTVRLPDIGNHNLEWQYILLARYSPRCRLSLAIEERAPATDFAPQASLYSNAL